MVNQKSKAYTPLLSKPLPKEGFQTIKIHESTRNLLKETANILGKTQGAVIDEYVKILSTWIFPYSRASITFDDSESDHTDPVKLKIVIMRISGDKKPQANARPPEPIDLVKDNG